MPDSFSIPIYDGSIKYPLGSVIYVNEVKIRCPFEINIIANVSFRINCSILSKVPFNLLQYRGCVVEHGEFYIIKLPKDIFFADESFFGFPVSCLEASTCEFSANLELVFEFQYHSKKPDVSFEISISDNIIKAQRVSYDTNEYFPFDYAGETNIEQEIYARLRGFYIVTETLPSNIEFFINDHFLFSFGKSNFMKQGKHICGYENYVDVMSDKLKNIKLPFGIDKYILHKILDYAEEKPMTFVYWIPNTLLSQESNNSNETLENSDDFTYVKKIHLRFPKEFTGSLYFVQHNELILTDGMGGLKWCH